MAKPASAQQSLRSLIGSGRGMYGRDSRATLHRDCDTNGTGEPRWPGLAVGADALVSPDRDSSVRRGSRVIGQRPLAVTAPVCYSTTGISCFDGYVMKQTPSPLSLEQLRMVAERPALNFVNTLDPRVGSETVDYLKSYADLTAWAVCAGVMSREVAARLTLMARHDSAQAEQALQSAIRLREALYRIFSALAAHGRPVPSDLGLLRTAFYEALGRAALEQQGRAFRWRLTPDLHLIRGSVARDAVALLESDALERLKLCPGSADCGWVFLDTSKNASRRWCSMAGCGNRAKARRHLHKIGARRARVSRSLAARTTRSTRRT